VRSIFKDALSGEKQHAYTLNTAMEELQKTSDKLQRFGIFHPTINMYLDEAPSSTPDRPALSALFSVSERGRLTLKTGTELGNAEGGGYFNATLRNVFGGAESLYGSASKVTSAADVGAHSRSSYEVVFAAPVVADPDTVAEIGGFVSSRNNRHFASHDEEVKGLRSGGKFLSRLGEHEVWYTGIWRQVTNVSVDASPSVREDAGDSIKSAVTHTLVRDRRDNKLLPTEGYFLRDYTEVAGFGQLGGDVAYIKKEVEGQKAATLFKGISCSAGLRAGLILPLPKGFGENEPPIPSRINDRFFLGGATDIRGFRENGIGPRDGQDAVGGDMFLAGSASLLFPLPRLGPSSPFRFQAFVNGGRLVGLQGVGKTDLKQSLMDAVREMGVGYPSMAAGVGLVYAHPAARFELNFALPVVKRAEERTRKGLQFGVGISFL